MIKAKKFLKWYKFINFIIGGFSIASLILVVPKIATPFIVGLFTTLGGSVPLLTIIYFFHYLPIKREGRASILVLKKRKEFINQQIDQNKKLVKTIFGTTDYVKASNNLINNAFVNEPLQKILLDQHKLIGELEMQELAIELEIAYKSIYSFDKYVYGIFHKKFFGLSNYEQYWNMSNKNT